MNIVLCRPNKFPAIILSSGANKMSFGFVYKQKELIIYIQSASMTDDFYQTNTTFRIGSPLADAISFCCIRFFELLFFLASGLGFHALLAALMIKLIHTLRIYHYDKSAPHKILMDSSLSHFVNLLSVNFILFIDVHSFLFGMHFQMDGIQNLTVIFPGYF